VVKSTEQVRFITRVADARTADPRARKVAEPVATFASEMDAVALLELLEQQMKQAAAELDFEAAATLRDQIFELRARTGRGERGAHAAARASR
jgi:excinuclease ABC subunit B